MKVSTASARPSTYRFSTGALKVQSCLLSLHTRHRCLPLAVVWTSSHFMRRLLTMVSLILNVDNGAKVCNQSCHW